MPNKDTTQSPHKAKLIIVSVIIGLLGGILMIGIPGALVLEFVGLTYTQLGMPPPELTGDSVWPIAIIIALFWPSALTPLYCYHYKKYPQHSKYSRWFFGLIGSLTITILITFLLLL